MTLKTYRQICILINEARYSDDPRARAASKNLGRWLRTLPEYETAMRQDAKQLSRLMR
jgi:hypothetical protein